MFHKDSLGMIANAPQTYTCLGSITWEIHIDTYAQTRHNENSQNTDPEKEVATKTMALTSPRNLDWKKKLPGSHQQKLLEKARDRKEDTNT